MLLGEIKLEALRLMFVNYDNDINIKDIPELIKDENYASYLNNMTGSINRCFSDIEEKLILPTKVITLTDSNLNDKHFSFDLGTISDFFEIFSVVKDGKAYESNCNYILEGNVLLLDRTINGNEYRLIYYPKINRITSATGDTTELEIPESIACLIPYFIKGDLFRDDEPNEASEARNWYEQQIRELHLRKNHSNKTVNCTYKQVES